MSLRTAKKMSASTVKLEETEQSSQDSNSIVSNINYNIQKYSKR